MAAGTGGGGTSSGFTATPSVLRGQVAATVDQIPGEATGMREPLVRTLAGLREESFGHLRDCRGLRNAYADCVAGADRDLGQLADDMAVLAGVVRTAAKLTGSADQEHARAYAALELTPGPVDPVGAS